MTFDLRALTQDDRAQLPQLMNDAFGRGRIATLPSPDEPAKPQSLCWGIFDGGRLVAAATIHDLTLLWGDTPFRMGGVAGVACVTDQRGRGHVGRLLKHSLVEMRAAGQPLGGLYPFSYAFYRRYGWEWVGEKRRYTVPLSEIPSYPEATNTSMVTVDDVLPELKECYARYARRYRGMTDRMPENPNYWNGLQQRDNRQTYVFAYRNPSNDSLPFREGVGVGSNTIDGYLSFRFPDDGDTGQIGDFFANTPEAYRGLMSMLHYYGTQLRKATWTAPVDDALPLHVMHQDLQSLSQPLFMGRLVDIAAAFEKLTPPSTVTGKVVINVDDRHCDWNTGPLAIEAEGGHITVQRTTDEPGITLDIQALSQAFWGQPGLTILRNAGRLAAVDERQFAILSQILPSTICYLQDFF